MVSDTATSITEKMISNNIGALIIISGSAPVGIVTERDIIRKVVRDRKDPDKMRAQDIMSSPLIAIEPDNPVREALRLMRDKEIRRLAVTKNGRLIGIVTERRLLDSLV